MKKFTFLNLLLGLLLLSNFSFAQIISQYVETNSGSVPKGIEIWNNTASTLDFTTNNLIVKKGTNGAAPANDVTISSGTLAAGAVLVIGTADMEATAVGNGSAFSLYVFTFNGDDALEIWYGATKTDVFGNPGSDPGSAWSGNGVSTANQNIQLLAGITAGDTDGWIDPSERFETVSTTPATLPAGLDGIGIAPAGGAPPTVEAPLFTPGSGTYYSAQNVTMTTATPGADIYYTTNGTDPDNTSTLYAGAVNIATTTTLKAIAFDGTNYSSITTGTYTIAAVVHVANMAALRAQADDNTTIYQVDGQVFLSYQQAYRNKKYIQDVTGGVEIDDPSGIITTSYSIGDGITGVIGKLNTYNGMLQFIPIMDFGAASSTGNTIVPVDITADEFNANHDTYEAMLVRILNLTFADAGSTFATGTVYPTTDVNSVGVNFRTSFYDASYIGTTIPTGGRDVVGIVNEYSNTPYLTSRESYDITNHVFAVPVSSAGIIIAGLLIVAVVAFRRGRFF